MHNNAIASRMISNQTSSGIQGTKDPFQASLSLQTQNGDSFSAVNDISSMFSKSNSANSFNYFRDSSQQSRLLLGQGLSKLSTPRSLYGNVGSGPIGTGGNSGSTTPVSLDNIAEFPTLGARSSVVGSSGVIGSGHFSMSSINSLHPQSSMLSNQLSSGLASRSQQQLNSSSFSTIMTKGPSAIEPNEFSIQYEDFPALPGAQNPPLTSNSSTSGTIGSAGGSISSSALSNSSTANLHPSQVSYMYQSSSNVSQQSSQQNAFPSSGSMSGVPMNSSYSPRVQLLPNNMVSNIPKSTIKDPFGMIGLLKLMKVGEIDPQLNLLAPGIDLTILGVNVGQITDIHPSFASPWHESCIGRPQDLDYPVPNEYRIRHLISDNLPEPSMEKLTEETLFWLFYNCTKEEAQIAAAKELHFRDWRFHKKEQCWLTRARPAESIGSDGERGYFIVWDPNNLTKVQRCLTMKYEDLDMAPSASKVSSLTYGMPLHHPKQTQQSVLQNSVSLTSQLVQQNQPVSSQHL